MSSLSKPILWNRSYLSWLILMAGILNLMVAINYTNKLVAMLNMFVAGFVFCTWFSDGLMNDYKRLVDKSLNLNKRLLAIHNAPKHHNTQKKSI